MYWTSEDIQPSVDLAEKLFGKSGIYSSNVDTTHSNVFLLTREFGNLDAVVVPAIPNRL